jgi:predicted nuclease of restriction endonuclease-like (RecB) superfamily
VISILQSCDFADGYRGKELEQALIDNIQKLLLELGMGFSYVQRS